MFYVYMLIYGNIRCIWGTLHREKERENFVSIIRVAVKREVCAPENLRRLPIVTF
jgi:hypothetical protein